MNRDSFLWPLILAVGLFLAAILLGDPAKGAEKEVPPGRYKIIYKGFGVIEFRRGRDWDGSSISEVVRIAERYCMRYGRVPWLMNNMSPEAGVVPGYGPEDDLYFRCVDPKNNRFDDGK